MRLREGKHRRKIGKFMIDGVRELDRAMQAGIRILEIFTVDPSLFPFCGGAREVQHTDTVVHQVTDSVMKKIAFGDRNEGIVAFAEEPVQSLAIFEMKIGQNPCPLLAVLEGIEKPGNLGAVFRSADAAGVDGVMIADSLVDPFHANAIRSSMGTVFSMPMVSESSATIGRWLKHTEFQIAATRCSGNAMPYTDVDFRRPTAIVFGSEAKGLTDIWSGKDITAVTLPMCGIADSLNVSVVAGILFYEVRRQRNQNRS